MRDSPVQWLPRVRLPLALAEFMSSGGSTPTTPGAVTRRPRLAVASVATPSPG